jgi:hypothetical protein
MPQPTTPSHARSTNIVIVSHTSIKSPNSTSHVGDLKPTFISHVGYLAPTSRSHDGGRKSTVESHFWGTTIVTSSHTGQTSPTSASHVGDQLLASTSHPGRMSPSSTSHIGGIDMIENPRHIGIKPKFLCRLGKGGHLTFLCPTTYVVREAWSFSDGSLGSKSSLVSQQYSPPLVDETVMP